MQGTHNVKLVNMIFVCVLTVFYTNIYKHIHHKFFYLSHIPVVRRKIKNLFYIFIDELSYKILQINAFF